MDADPNGPALHAAPAAVKPVIALVGRPNVGKSTLFNQLTRSRDALVADQPGLTRDRKYGDGRVGDRPFIVIDTGGLSGEAEGIDSRMAEQTLQAVEEAERIIFLVDGREGLAGPDEMIAAQLRRFSKPVQVAVNKTDGVDAEVALSDFYALGLGPPLAIAAAHGRGVRRLIEQTLADLPPVAPVDPADEPLDEDAGEGPRRIRIAVVGRPNVGKSTLVNRLLGEERVIAFDQPGTTRDSVFIDFDRDGQAYTLIDTAGVRRRGKVHDRIEKFSVIKALQAIDASHVVIMLIDARSNLSEQDLSLLGYVLDSGRALVLAVNKWDGLSQDQRQAVRRELDRRLSFAGFADLHLISALHGSGVGKLLESVQRAYRAARRKLSTPELTRLLEMAVEQHQPPLVHGRRVKLRYAHQGGHNPPLIVIHGNQTERLPGAYQRYLVNWFREALKLRGTPLRLEFKTGENPFAGRRNPLSPRQQARRKRMMKHVKRGG